MIVRPLDEVPDLLALHATQPARYPFLLESAAYGTPQGRYDILLGCPGETLALGADGQLTGPVPGPAEDFLEALDRWWHQEREDPELLADARPGSGLLTFRGGWFLFLGYELAGQVEPTLRLPPAVGLPVAFATRIPAAISVDRQAGRAWVVAEAGCDELAELLGYDARACPPLAPAGPGAEILQEPLTEDPPEAFLEAVDRAKRYIVDGDIFQANLSREWRGRLRPGVATSTIYARLRDANPGPFAGLATWGDSAIVSSSPERLLRLAAGGAETRPIAGTRPRGRGAHADARLSAELLAHPKERAEHIMLIDLERNDLGRICSPGTVRVDELMALESYAHVHHIVSNVRGVLRAGVTPGSAIRAVFPGGTITGCPKVRCMEIIAELERGPRGPYTGSMGYLNRDGSCDLNILIRTLVRSGERVSLRAGSGIVADSGPAAELEETRAKARGLLLALEDAET